MVSQGKACSDDAKNIWEETITKSQFIGGIYCLWRLVAFAKEKLQEMTVA
jgi:hypothetical protein